MKICLVSGYRDNPDEGIKNFAYQVFKELSDFHKIIHINARENIFSINFWRRIKAFNPQIIHIFLRPSIPTLGIGKIFKLSCNNAKLVVSSLQPPLNYSFIKAIIPLSKPDLMLIQSYKTEENFRGLGCKTVFLPSGVDTAKFIPVHSNAKEKLREKYGIDKEKFVVLHVGHLNKGRNLEVFKTIAKNNKDVEVILIGSINTFNFDENVYNDLKDNGCKIWRKYFENIEEIYQLSDCYIFPTIDESCAIELPLSVMEAMSCNLPVISTKFGGLNRIFKEGEGMIFVDSTNEIKEKLEIIRRKNPQRNTRKQVLPYSWKNVASCLEEMYENLVSE